MMPSRPSSLSTTTSGDDDFIVTYTRMARYGGLAKLSPPPARRLDRDAKPLPSKALRARHGHQDAPRLPCYRASRRR